MKLALYTFLLLFIAVSCTDKKEEETTNKPKTEKLTEIKNGRFTEWYPGKKQIKFQGMLTKKAIETVNGLFILKQEMNFL